MKKFKKIIAMGCAAVMAMSVMSMNAFAANNEIMPLSLDIYEDESFTKPYNTNNYFTEAQEINDDNNVYGKINSEDDVDFYKITFENNNTANFYIKAPTNCVYEIEVYIKNGSNYTKLAKGSYSGDRERLISGLSVSAGVTYYIKVSRNTWSPISNETYLLRARQN